MEKLLVAIMTIAVVLVGVLHAGYSQHSTFEDISTAQQYTNQYPEEMPDISLQPMTNVPCNW